MVAVSTYMASEHGNRCDQKEWFMTGYNEMLRRIEPEKIICYNTPFPEMRGDIVYIDYERSSWKYMSYERAFRQEELESFKICGQTTDSHDIIVALLFYTTQEVYTNFGMFSHRVAERTARFYPDACPAKLRLSSHGAPLSCPKSGKLFGWRFEPAAP